MLPVGFRVSFTARRGGGPTRNIVHGCEEYRPKRKSAAGNFGVSKYAMVGDMLRNDESRYGRGGYSVADACADGACRFSNVCPRDGCLMRVSCALLSVLWVDGLVRTSFRWMPPISVARMLAPDWHLFARAVSFPKYFLSFENGGIPAKRCGKDKDRKGRRCPPGGTPSIDSFNADCRRLL